MMYWEFANKKLYELKYKINAGELKIKCQKVLGGDKLNYLDLNRKLKDEIFKFITFWKKSNAYLSIPKESNHNFSHKMVA